MIAIIAAVAVEALFFRRFIRMFYNKKYILTAFLIINNSPYVRFL